MRLRPLITFVGIALCAATPAFADSAADIAAIRSVFAAAKIDAGLFTSAYTQQVPIDGVQGFVDSYKARLGPPTTIIADGTQYRVISLRGSIFCNVALDASGKISNLLFHDEESAPDLAALERVMAASKVDPAWFEASFSNDVPISHVDDVIATLHTKFGAFTRIETRKKGYFAVFARGAAHAQISLTADGKIDYLAFTEN